MVYSNKKYDDILNLNSFFNNEWFNDVCSAIELVLHFNKKSGIDEQNIINEIIYYNINKMLNEHVFIEAINNLPKKLNWKDKDYNTVLNEFKNIIKICDICPNFKNIDILITFNNEIIEKSLEFFKNIANIDYNKLYVCLKKQTQKNKILLSIEKLNYEK